MVRIVVGVDGSPSADRALRWAAEAAQRTGAALEVVRAFDAHGGRSVVGSDLGTGECVAHAECPVAVIPDPAGP